MTLNLPYFEDLSATIENIVTSQPVQEALVLDNNAVSVFFGYNFIMKELKPNIKLPFENYVLENGVFTFNIVEGRFLKVGANGIVKNIGYIEGKKYIEVMHDGNIKSVFVNLDIIGVNTNLKVQKGEIIATVKGDSPIIFYIKYNDEILRDFSVKGSEIIWKD